MHRPPLARRDSPADDDYAWLRADNWREVMRDPAALAPEIRRHLEAEAAHLEAVLAPARGLRERLYEEMRGRLPEDDASVPERDGRYRYYRRLVAAGEQPLLCRRRDGGREEVLLDGNAEAEGLPFFQLGAAAHSPDHRLLAYTVDTTGAELHEVRIRDIAGGAALGPGIVGAAANLAWGNDSATLYYTLHDANHRPFRICRHRLGRPAAADETLYEEADPAFHLSLSRGESRRFVTIVARDHSATTELRVIDADRADATPRTIASRRRGVTCEGGEWRGRFILRTNADGAEDFKIVEAPADDPAPANWRELVPHRPGVFIVDMLLFHDWLVRRERIEGQPRLVVRDLRHGGEHAIAFDEAAYTVTAVPGHEFRTDRLRFVYSSPATPEETVDYDMRRHRRRTRKRQRLPSGHDPKRYTVSRLLAPSHDGTPVPVSLLHLKDAPRDGSAPLWLYAYGAYGLSVPANFVPHRLSLVDRGFVFAIAHVRGGSEGGYRWYRQGKLQHKRNSFLDTVAAAEALIGAGYTGAGNIVLNGRSAGGMLVGAVANLRPELFRAAIAEVPFVDVLNTMSDASLPLTPPEWDEWGNPIEDAAARAYIAAYCPYQNLARQAYPHVLATGGLTDPRVTYWEPAKWIARLRALRTDPGLTLLHMNMEAGHAGSAGRFERLREFALLYAFALTVCGRADG